MDVPLFRKLSSSIFQYSERTINSTETNDTSEEISDTQLFATGKFEGVALSGGCYVSLPGKQRSAWGKKYISGQEGVVTPQ